MVWIAVTVLAGSVISAGQEPIGGIAHHYDPVVDATVESVTLTHDLPVHVQVSTVYLGQRREGPPKRVELLISKDGPVIADARTSELSVALLVNGERFRHGTLNARDVSGSNAVALVFSFDEFTELAQARTVGGQAFGVTFALTGEQLVVLQMLAERWASSEPMLH